MTQTKQDSRRSSTQAQDTTNEPFVEISIDFDAWAEAWLRSLLSSDQPAINVRDLGALLRASFERNIPDDHVSMVESQ